MSKQTKYTKSARGQECQVRIHGICNHNPETTVLAHLNGGGMGMKSLDIHAAFACSNCHDAIDRRSNLDLPKFFVDRAHYEGVIRTQKIWVSSNVLKL